MSIENLEKTSELVPIFVMGEKIAYITEERRADIISFIHEVLKKPMSLKASC